MICTISKIVMIYTHSRDKSDIELRESNREPLAMQALCNSKVKVL